MSGQLETTAHRCEWDDGRTQYHDESDPMPEKWDGGDRPDFVQALTPLYEAKIALEDMRIRAEKAESALAECREDAERYHTVRDLILRDPTAPMNVHERVLYRLIRIDCAKKGTWDAAVDAARAK